VKRLCDGQPRNCGWITNRSNRRLYSLNSHYNSGAHPAPYSVEGHRSFSGQKVVGASRWPLYSILYTMLTRLELRTNLRPFLPVEDTHSSTRMMKNATGETARNICHGVSLHLELHKRLHFLCRLPAQLSKQIQPVGVCLQITLKTSAQFVLLTTQYIPSPILTHQHSPYRIRRVPPSNFGPATDYSDWEFRCLSHRCLVISKCFNSTFNRPGSFTSTRHSNSSCQ
jgi:hypothetical protein